MAWENGFFNSINGDRLYNAETMNKIFEGLITNGVYESVGNKLAVAPNSGMVIQIDTGRGWFNNHWVSNDVEYLITLESSDVLLNRYAAICIKVDENDESRSALPYVKYSEYATNPVKPTMTRSELVNEYCLAYVYIPANAATITAANIEDTRGNNELCGWVTGLIEQLSTTTLFAQWEAIFSEWSESEKEVFTDWFNSLRDMIDENVETMLVNALPTSVTVTLTSSGWTSSSGVYTQTVQVINMNTTKSVIVQPNSASADDYSDNEIKATAQSTNTLTFTATSKPTSNIIVDVLHMGV